MVGAVIELPSILSATRNRLAPRFAQPETSNVPAILTLAPSARMPVPPFITSFASLPNVKLPPGPVLIPQPELSAVCNDTSARSAMVSAFPLVQITFFQGLGFVRSSLQSVMVSAPCAFSAASPPAEPVRLPVPLISSVPFASISAPFLELSVFSPLNTSFAPSGKIIAVLLQGSVIL